MHRPIIFLTLPGSSGKPCRGLMGEWAVGRKRENGMSDRRKSYLSIGFAEKTGISADVHAANFICRAPTNYSITLLGLIHWQPPEI